MRIVLSLALVACGSGVFAQTPNVIDLIGKTRSEIASVFPGSGKRLEQWNGWKTVTLFFNVRGELVTLTLQPAAPITEQHADEAVRGLGLNVDRADFFAAATERGYSDMAGPIRTVSYQVDGDEVTAIGIFSRLADID